jgi:group I intron endonuclease
MEYGCIYLITNHKNGKMYVGQHNKTNVVQRWRAHKQKASVDVPEYQLHKAMKKHGIENFTINILHIVPYSALNKYEIYFADLLNTYVWNKRGYNSVFCGGGGGGREITEETRQKLRDSHKGQMKTENTIAKASKSISQWYKDNPEAVSIKMEKISKSLKGRSNAGWGSHSSEINAKISATLTGKPKTKEHNLKVSQSNYHGKGGKLGEKYIQQNKTGFYVRINNKMYGQMGKQFKTKEEAIVARNEFIEST